MRQKDNPAVADFSRLFAKEQADRNVPSTTGTDTTPVIPAEVVPTECILYGYGFKASEWKVISRYERIVAPSVICEDYPREDPNLYLNSNSPMGFNRSSIVVHKNLSKDAIKKSRVYKGGQHWIKVTFDSYDAAERACFYSPIEIDGHEVHCEMYHGKGPTVDAPIPASMNGAGSLISPQKAQTVSATSRAQKGKSSAVAGFEQAVSSTLPRSHTMPDVQYRQPYASDDMDLINGSSQSSATASSATATNAPPSSGLDVQKSSSDLRSRSVPNLPPPNTLNLTSQYMSRTPGIRKAILRPTSEALPPQQTFVERVIRSIPVVSWVLGFSAPKKATATTLGADGQRIEAKQEERQLIGDGPTVKDDGTWDEKSNGWYWGFWYGIDRLIGTDFCGLKEE